MAEPYTSKYSGAQIDAAVKAIGIIPTIYVSYEEYSKDINVLKNTSTSMKASFDYFFSGINLNNQTFQVLFSDEIMKLKQQYQTDIVDNYYSLTGVFYEKV